jgi:two-component system, NtrC family, response regulator HydG
MERRERSNASARESLPSLGLTSASHQPPFPKTRNKELSSVLDRVARYARDESIIILFEGESGTGKSWLARHAHQLSSRSSHTLCEESIADINDSLVASDLFGHVLGAFTDAKTQRPGAFQSANHSTLFLDELGKATPFVQKHLLRAIEERVIRPVGSDRPIKVDVRLMVASNVDLELLVAKGLFLPDLYARLGHFHLRLPPLRERREDIPDLARYFLAQRASQFGYSRGLPTVHHALMQALQHAEWTYNLRELDNAMHYLMFEADSAAQLTLDHCTGKLAYLRGRSRGRPKKATPARVIAAVQRTGSVTAAARELSVSRSTIHRHTAKLRSELPIPPVAKPSRAD